ncbi:MAG: hypothetical protein KJ947_15705 [Alphaproteobacteria bacterium]|nr:hypothetical protein [Alphaproteobacteria bacterium]MBU1551005.1 hypothetical protein [Alphaproteobacteria bacterium]MBU2339141.1 hypothetical protein [Alphaproteobacteria bacterium]MBU2387232.1 hypothetical protein [Alphaproteobacteria bacterium]
MKEKHVQPKFQAFRTSIFTPQDVSAMRDAFLLVVTECAPQEVSSDDAPLGRAIIRLYRMGLVDPMKLAAAAALLSTSKTFSNPDLFQLS